MTATLRPPCTTEPVVVAVCSPDSLAMPGIRHMLRDRPDICVVRGDRLVEAAIALVVVDELDDAVFTLLDRLARSSPARVVLLAEQIDEEHVADLARCRVAAVLARRTVDTDRLAGAITDVLWRPACPPPKLVALLRQMAVRLEEPETESGAALSSRERAVLRLLADGHDTAEIASAMSYSERAIKRVVHQLLSRLELRNRAHAVAYALRAGQL